MSLFKNFFNVPAVPSGRYIIESSKYFSLGYITFLSVIMGAAYSVYLYSTYENRCLNCLLGNKINYNMMR